MTSGKVVRDAVKSIASLLPNVVSSAARYGVIGASRVPIRGACGNASQNYVQAGLWIIVTC